MANDKKKVVRRVKATTGSSNTNSTKTVTKKVSTKPAETADKMTNVTKTTTKKQPKTTGKKAQPTKRPESDKKPFILFRPFVALGHYIADSWRELKQVQWPSRRAAWKMTLAVILFCLFIGLFILLIDWLSQMLIQEVIL